MAPESPTLRERCGFLHIPKTAGSSVRAALLAAYGPGCVSPYVFDEVLFGPFTAWHTMAPGIRDAILHADHTPTEAERAVPAVAAHMSYRSITSLVDEHDVVTVLREPRSRVLSHQLFWSTLPAAVTDEYGEYQAHRVAFDGLKRFLTDPAGAHQADNLHVRMLADLDVDPTRALSPAERTDAARAAQAAVHRLGCTTFVESPTFWRDLSSFVGLGGDEVRENITGSGEMPPPFSGPQFDRETLELLDERTVADSIVYRAVVASTLGLDDVGAAAFADRAFLTQVERYCRIVAHAEVEHRRVADPGPPPSPAEPVPPPRVRTGLGIVARRLISAVGRR